MKSVHLVDSATQYEAPMEEEEVYLEEAQEFVLEMEQQMEGSKEASAIEAEVKKCKMRLLSNCERRNQIFRVYIFSSKWLQFLVVEICSAFLI